MQLVRRTLLGLVIAGMLLLTGCGAFEQSPPPPPMSGTITDIGGQDDSYSIQLNGSDKVWSCYAPGSPICRLLKKGDTISFSALNESAMWKVTRTANAE